MEKGFKLKLTKFQRQVIVGTLLGDAHAERYDKGYVLYRLKFLQSDKHKAYLFHLYDIFSGLCTSPPFYRERERTMRNVIFTAKSWSFSTLFLVELAFYGKYFYNAEKQKRVPRNIGRFLTPIVLAYWYMDDGSIKFKESKGVILNTHGFKSKEIDVLINALNVKFGLQATPRKQKDGCQIYISGHSYEHFVTLVQPYIHPSMLYKLPLPRKSRI